MSQTHRERYHFIPHEDPSKINSHRDFRGTAKVHLESSKPIRANVI